MLQCDIRKCFDSIDHRILYGLIRKKINDPDLLWLIALIIKSFEAEAGKGLPLGNVTSQLFANIYLNELDQYAKHALGIKKYIRYSDDFAIVSRERRYIVVIVPRIKDFLERALHLSMHERKIIVRKHIQGIDFLGYVVMPYYRALRTRTKRRMLGRERRGELSCQSFPSYCGMLKHCRGFKIERQLRNFLEIS